MLFESRRLLFREIGGSDFDLLYAMLSDPEVMRYISDVKDEKATRQWIDLVEDSYRRHGYGPWAVAVRETRRFIGYCGIYLQEDVGGRDEVELLYGLDPRYWNRGYATEAAKAARHYAMEVVGIDRLVSLVAPENIASARVAEKQGMKKEKQVRKWGRLFDLYAIGHKDLAHLESSKPGS